MVDYSQLYYCKEVKVSHESLNYPIELSVEINDLSHIADCKVGHFGHNFWYRTNAGLKKQRYTSANRLEKAVEQLLKKKGFSILGWVNKN